MNYFLIVSACAICLFGCRAVETEVSEESRAEQLLNERRFSEAIELLKELSANKPEKGQLKLWLASAYAGSVGIDVVDGFDAYKSLVVSSQGAQDSSQEDSTRVEIEVETLRLLKEFSGLYEILANTPYADESKRRVLYESLLVLDSVPPGGKLFWQAKVYSGLINTLQALNYFREAFPALIGTRDWSLGNLACNMDVKVFGQSIGNTAKHISKAVSDWTIASRIRPVNFAEKIVLARDKAERIKKLYENEADTLSASAIAKKIATASLCSK